MPNPTRPMVLTELPFVAASFGYKVPEGHSWREMLNPEWWLADQVIRRLKTADTIRVIDENGPVIVDLLILSANPYAEGTAAKLSLAPMAVYPPDLELPAAAAAPEYRIRYARAIDLYEIVSRDGAVIDQLSDLESAQRVLGMMSRPKSEAPTALAVAMLAARPLQRSKPRTARPRGRPRKPAPSTTHDAPPPPLAASAE